MTLGQRWAVYTAAPHRVMMFGGAVQIIVTLVYWTAELTGRYTRLWAPLPTVVPGVWAHGFLMIYTLFPFFIYGFLMTTYPRWMNGPEIPRGRYVGTFLAMAAGVLTLYIGLFVSPGVMAAGVALLLGGWLSGLGALLRVYRAAPARDKRTETVLNLALSMAAVGMALYLLWLLTGWPRLVRLALGIGLWAFLVPVLISVAQRMIPFFSNSVLKGYQPVQPRWVLPLAPLGLLAHLALDQAGLLRWLFVPDLFLAAMGLYLTTRWGLRRSFEVRLLAMLHVGFAWFSVAMVLYAAQSLVLFADGRFILGRGPLHALGIGFVASTTVAMVSRVTLGHSGRALVADTFTWACFWGVTVAALLRVAGDAPVIYAPGGIPLNLIAALVWLASLTPWAVRYGRMHWQRRVDGRPG